MTEGLSFVKSRFGCFLTPLLSNCCFFDVFPLLHCNARRRTNTIHLFAKKCVRRVLNLLSGRLSCPYGVLKLLPYILRRKTQGRCHEVTEGLSFLKSIQLLFNPSPKKKLSFFRFLPYILRCNTPQCCGTRQGRR